MHYTIATLTLAAALFLGGCGQMGPLYEPDTTPPPATTTGTSSTPAP
jgi:predicted small lipoprotein YifL